MRLTRDYMVECADNCEMGVEIYRSRWGKNSFHTDNIQYLDMMLEDLPEEFEGEFQEMDMEDYNNSVMANCGEREEGWGDNTMLCILVYNI